MKSGKKSESGPPNECISGFKKAPESESCLFPHLAPSPLQCCGTRTRTLVVAAFATLTLLTLLAIGLAVVSLRTAFENSHKIEALEAKLRQQKVRAENEPSNQFSTLLI